MIDQVKKCGPCGGVETKSQILGLVVEWERVLRRGNNLGRCSDGFKPQSTQRARRGPVVTGSAERNGLGLIRQWNDYTGRQGPKNKNEVLSHRAHREHREAI